MSAIAGILNLDAPVGERGLAALIGAVGADAFTCWRTEGRIGLSASRRGALRTARGGRILVADARIDNASELRRALGLPAVPDVDEHRADVDGDLILSAYDRWGEECVRYLTGDFAFALWDSATQSLFCARDPMGVRPLYYWQSSNRFCFSSDVHALLSLPGVPAETDETRVVQFLLNADAGRERTFYRGVRRLPAAHQLTRTPAAFSVKRYWEPDAGRELRLSSDAEYAEAFADIFREAVRSRTAGTDVVASTLSGGLDSSSIACLARDLLDGGVPLHTVSLVFPGIPSEELRLIDERRYIEVVTRGGGVIAHVVRGDRISPLGEMHGMVRTLSQPFAAPNLYLHWAMFASASNAGCHVFLDGFDGDSVVSHGLSRLDELLAAGNWRRYESETHAFANRRQISPAKVVRSFGMPRLDWLAATGQWSEWSRTARALHRDFGFSRRELLVNHGIRASRAGHRLLPQEPTLAERVVRASLREYEQPASQPLSARASHIAGLMQPAYQDTLEAAYHCSRAFGLDARFPFFDRRLIDFCVALPAEQKFDDGWTRRVMRNAMKGILPEEIRLRVDKGNLLPAFHRGLRNDDAVALMDIDLRRLDGLVDIDRLGRMRDEYLNADPAAGGATDPMLLLRCATLAVWMDGQKSLREGADGSRPAAALSPALDTLNGVAHTATPRS